MNSPAPELSIIIPAYNEEARLPRAFERIRSYLTSRGMNADQVEILEIMALPGM